MSLFTKKEIIEYQVSKWDRFDSWKSCLRDTNHYIRGIIEDEEFKIKYWLGELVSCYDLENLKSLN